MYIHKTMMTSATLLTLISTVEITHAMEADPHAHGYSMKVLRPTQTVYKNEGTIWNGSFPRHIRVDELAEDIQHTSRLQSLELAYSNLGEKEMDLLAQALRVNQSVTYLDISYCHLTDNALAELGQAISSNPHSAIKTIVMRDIEPQFTPKGYQIFKKELSNIEIVGPTGNLLTDFWGVVTNKFQQSSFQ